MENIFFFFQILVKFWKNCKLFFLIWKIGTYEHKITFSGFPQSEQALNAGHLKYNIPTWGRNVDIKWMFGITIMDKFKNDYIHQEADVPHSQE